MLLTRELLEMEFDCFDYSTGITDVRLPQHEFDGEDRFREYDRLRILLASLPDALDLALTLEEERERIYDFGGALTMPHLLATRDELAEELEREGIPLLLPIEEQDCMYIICKGVVSGRESGIYAAPYSIFEDLLRGIYPCVYRVNSDTRLVDQSERVPASELEEFLLEATQTKLH